VELLETNLFSDFISVYIINLVNSPLDGLEPYLLS